MSESKATPERKRELVAASNGCTLDGKPALVCGSARDYGIVATTPDGPRFEYAWSTIERVLSTPDRAFRS